MRILKKIIAKKQNVKGADPVTIAFFGDSVTQGCFELYKTSPQSFQTEFRVEDGYLITEAGNIRLTDAPYFIRK